MTHLKVKFHLLNPFSEVAITQNFLSCSLNDRADGTVIPNAELLTNFHQLTSHQSSHEKHRRIAGHIREIGVGPRELVDIYEVTFQK